MKKSRKKIIFVMIMLAMLVFMSFTITYAKYIYNSTLDYYLKTKGFYFESDSLGINTIKNANIQWDGSNIEFNLKNSLGENLVTNYDISYKVTCSIEGDAKNYAECKINDDKNIYEGKLSGYDTCLNTTSDKIDVSKFTKNECEISGYNWIETPSIQNLYFNVNLIDISNELSDIKVKLVAESIDPYSKTLMGEYTLRRTKLEDESIISNYENYANYDRLTISNSYDIDKCVLVSWDSSNIRIDADVSHFLSYETDSNDYIKQIKTEINSKSNVTYLFYKTNINSNYTINDINIEKLESCK